MVNLVQKKNRIGIDIDDCLGDIQTTFCRLANKFFNKNLKLDDCISESGKFVDQKLVSKVETRLVITSSEYINSMKKLKPFPNAVEAINELSNDYYIYFITSRDNYRKNILISDVEEWLKSIGIKEYEEVILTRKKAEVSMELNIDLFVDDTVLAAKSLVEKHIPVILFDRPWNKNYKEKNVYRCKHWKDMPSIVKRVLKSK